MAIGGVFHCLAENIAIKERLAIFGFNGLSIGAALPLPLSTIRSHRFEIGKTAVKDDPRQQGEAAASRRSSTSATRSSSAPRRDRESEREVHDQ